MAENKPKVHQVHDQNQESTVKDASAGGNVDQIRDILFGSQMKDYERKFSRLEERILKEVSNLKEDSNKRLDSLQAFINGEIESLTNKVKSEKENRNDSIKELATDLSNTAKAIEKKLSVLEDGTEKDVRELRQSLLEQSKTLLNEIDNKHKEGMGIVDRSVTELRDDKIDRNTLSGLLTEVAIRLADSSHYQTDD